LRIESIEAPQEVDKGNSNLRNDSIEATEELDEGNVIEPESDKRNDLEPKDEQGLQTQKTKGNSAATEPVAEVPDDVREGATTSCSPTPRRKLLTRAMMRKKHLAASSQVKGRYDVGEQGVQDDASTTCPESDDGRSISVGSTLTPRTAPVAHPRHRTPQRARQDQLPLSPSNLRKLEKASLESAQIHREASICDTKPKRVLRKARPERIESVQSAAAVAPVEDISTIETENSQLSIDVVLEKTPYVQPSPRKSAAQAAALKAAESVLGFAAANASFAEEDREFKQMLIKFKADNGRPKGDLADYLPCSSIP